MSAIRKTELSGLRLSRAFQLEAKATAEGAVEGLASPFGGEPDAYGDIIAPGAFRSSIERHRKRGTAPALLWAHDAARPVGTWQRLEERPDGLHVKGALNLKSSAGSEAFEHLRHGDVTGLSIGFTLPGGVSDYSGNNRVLREVELHEISLVTIPAADTARIYAVKGLELKSRAELRDLLRESGLSRAAADKLSKGGWPALGISNQPETLAKLADALRKAARKM